MFGYALDPAVWQVLRAADGVLYEGQLRLARRQRRLSAAFARVLPAPPPPPPIPFSSLLLRPTNRQ